MSCQGDGVAELAGVQPQVDDEGGEPAPGAEADQPGEPVNGGLKVNLQLRLDDPHGLGLRLRRLLGTGLAVPLPASVLLPLLLNAALVLLKQLAHSEPPFG